MPIRRPAKIPEAILHLQQQLDQWRGAQKGRAKLPESFWRAAVELAKQYGVFRTAQPLRLDYTRLKQRLRGAAGRTVSGWRKAGEFVVVRSQPPGLRPSARPDGCFPQSTSSEFSLGRLA